MPDRAFSHLRVRHPCVFFEVQLGGVNACGMVSSASEPSRLVYLQNSGRDSILRLLFASSLSSLPTCAILERDIFLNTSLNPLRKVHSRALLNLQFVEKSVTFLQNLARERRISTALSSRLLCRDDQLSKCTSGQNCVFHLRWTRKRAYRFSRDGKSVWTNDTTYLWHILHLL